MVLSRTRPVMARYDVAPAMVKWWKSQLPDNGQIVRSLSPYEQQTSAPWIRTFPKRAYDKFMGGGIWGAGTAALVYGVASLSIDADNAEDFQHRY